MGWERGRYYTRSDVRTAGSCANTSGAERLARSSPNLMRSNANAERPRRKTGGHSGPTGRRNRRPRRAGELLRLADPSGAHRRWLPPTQPRRMEESTLSAKKQPALDPNTTFSRSGDTLTIRTSTAGVKDLLARAQAGDGSTLPELRKLLDHPEAVNMLGGDLARETQAFLIRKYAGKGPPHPRSLTAQAGHDAG